MEERIYIAINLFLYGENRLKRFQEHVLGDAHFVGFNYHGNSYRLFFAFDDGENYVDILQDIEFKLSMGAEKKTMFTLVAVVKSRPINFCFNLASSEFLTAKNEQHLFPNL